MRHDRIAHHTGLERLAQYAANSAKRQSTHEVIAELEAIAKRLNGGKRPVRLGPGLGEPR
jgi:hypothetical protein